MSDIPPPYKSGYLPVSDGYELYYEVWGNPNGKTVLYLHGGPGAGFSDKDKRFFDPEKWNVIFFDQRGAGRSKPFASIENNTTQKLTEDINTLLDFLGYQKVFIFGGSWGSTLALVYGIENLDRVNGMLIRGIFNATQAEVDYYAQGGIETFCPQAWNRFISIVPQEERRHVASYYLKQMQSSDKTIREKFTYEWAYYEISVIKMEMTQEQITEYMTVDLTYESLSPLEAHYMVNRCFLPDGYILEHASLLSSLPISIVHGRYDVICPPINAYKLQQKIGTSQLHFVTAGHSSSEPAIENKLIEELNRMYPLIP